MERKKRIRKFVELVRSPAGLEAFPHLGPNFRHWQIEYLCELFPCSRLCRASAIAAVACSIERYGNLVANVIELKAYHDLAAAACVMAEPRHFGLADNLLTLIWCYRVQLFAAQ